MVWHGQGIIEKYHHGIAGKSLECPVVLRDQRSYLCLVLPQHGHQVLGISGLRKGGEASKINEYHRNFCSMPSEKIFTIFGDDHVSQVQRQESRHFLLLELGKLSLLSPRPNEVIDTGQELILIKRLRQIIIRSCVETFDARLR